MRAGFFGALIAGAYIITDIYGGGIEGRFLPVVADVRFERVEPVGVNASRIWGRFDRVRDCEFAGLDFFLGVVGKSSLAAITFEEGSKVREGGVHDFGPWVVQLTPEQLEVNSYSVATHTCHPFWETKTQFH